MFNFSNNLTPSEKYFGILQPQNRNRFQIFDVDKQLFKI